MSTISWVYSINHTLSGGGVGTVKIGEGDLWKSTIFPNTFNFLAWFLLFLRGFLALKKCWCVLIFGRGSQKVYGLYTHENVDIYGWPLNNIQSIQKWCIYDITKCLLDVIDDVHMESDFDLKMVETYTIWPTTKCT